MDKKTVIVLAGGESAKDYAQDLHKYGYVIGVNDSGLNVKCDAIVSMDRLWMQNRYDDVVNKSVAVYFRLCAFRKSGKPEFRSLNLFDGNTDEGIMSMCVSPLNLWGDNSGACALNLAYQMRPDMVFLYGFDMGGDYWYDRYEWKDRNTSSGKFKEWSSKFKIKADQFKNIGCDVYNVNLNSNLDAFEKISHDEFLEMV